MASLQQQEILQILLQHRIGLLRSGLIITRDFHASEDIYQNLVLKSLNSDLDFEDTAKLLAWSKKVIRTESIDWRKRGGRELTLEDNQILELLHLEYLDDLEESTKLASYSDILEDCLGKLNPESSRLLNLRYDGNRNCNEVAHLLGISLESVYKRLSRIHLLLRDCVKSKINDNLMPGGFKHGT